MAPALRELTEVPVSGVRIWSAHLDLLSQSEMAALHALLSTNERERAARFHFQRDRDRFVAARGLLRSLLGEILPTPAAEIEFSYGAQGKPALASGGPPHFNLSHAAGWALFALSERREVGIDLESLARMEESQENLPQLTARILSARELAIWKNLTPPDQPAAFIRAWTRKEACGKASGRGLLQGLEKMEVILDAAAPARSLTIRATNENGLTSDLLLHDLSAPAGFAGALAVRTN